MSNDDRDESLPIETDQFVTGVHYPHPFDDLATALCESAVRCIRILSPNLDHRVFDRVELVAAVGNLARHGRQTEVRILVADSRQLVARGHRMLQLARRLPGSVRIQTLAEHPQWNAETVITRDRNGVLYKPGDSDHEGFFEPDSRASTQKHLELFDELWRHSTQDVELRTLSL